VRDNVYKIRDITIFMNKWAELLLGLAIVIVVIVLSWYSAYLGGFWNFRHAAWELFKGAIVWVLLGIGFIFIVLGISDLKE
jgi:hypothetical protein